MHKVFCLIIVLVTMAYISVFAQDEVSEQKVNTDYFQKILSNAPSLRRPENRAYVYARVGHALWKEDEKFARTLFQDSINELISAQVEIERIEYDRNKFEPLIYGQSPRWGILWTIADRDAETAFDLMLKSRPGRVSQLMGVKSNQSRLYQFANTELQNEQRLLALMIDQNPERAVKYLRENLKKHYSYQTLETLRKVFQKDAVLANSLAEEIGRSFLTSDINSENEKIGNLATFLTGFIESQRQTDESNLKISDGLLRDLASKLIDVYLDPYTNYIQVNPNLNIFFEKNFAARYEALKKKIEKSNKTNQTPQLQKLYKLLEQNSSPEELFSEGEKLPKEMRSQINRRAVSLIAESGDLSRARELFKENFPNEDVEAFISSYIFSQASTAIGQLKFDEGFRLLELVGEKRQKFMLLTYMAMTAFNADKEKNKNFAISVLEQARSVLAEMPENETDINALGTLAEKYSLIEPERAFPILEQLVTPINEISQANAVLAKYRGSGNFRLGEFQIDSDQYMNGTGSFGNVLNNLKTTDFERVWQITNGFSRTEIRLLMQLNLIDNSGITNLTYNYNTILRRRF